MDRDRNAKDEATFQMAEVGTPKVDQSFPKIDDVVFAAFAFARFHHEIQSSQDA